MVFGFFGIYNCENVVVVCVMCVELGFMEFEICYGFKIFKGIKCCFEFYVCCENFVYIDDYVYYFIELKVFIDFVCMFYLIKYIIGIFQLYLFFCICDFMEGFVEQFSWFDQVILMFIYLVCELLMEGIISEVLFEKIIMEK